MSQFGTLTITMLHPVESVEVVPAPIGKFRKLMHKLTSTKVPTMELRIPHTHTVEVTEYDDWETLSNVLECAEHFGYTFPSVVWASEYGLLDELTETSAGIPNASELSAFFIAVQDADKWKQEAVAAYVSEFGWFSVAPDMEDVHYGSYDSPKDFAMSYVEGTQEHVERHKGYYEKETVPALDALPSYVVIDWEETARMLEASGFTYTRFNGSTHVFTV